MFVGAEHMARCGEWIVGAAAPIQLNGLANGCLDAENGFFEATLLDDASGEVCVIDLGDWIAKGSR